MDNAADGQVSRSAADVYEEFFVPALLSRFVRSDGSVEFAEEAHIVTWTRR